MSKSVCTAMWVPLIVLSTAFASQVASAATYGITTMPAVVDSTAMGVTDKFQGGFVGPNM